ncbi:hypothetical protein MKW94_009710 [Papaver nudicaule]|uniref:Uncharacterized protein n=1 Tax=Papaver nudicaule TaxID=74823 RepID=A0AA41S6W6_PAPNU|nr:hypothetical protein [Papaver nudicaule]
MQSSPVERETTHSPPLVTRKVGNPLVVSTKGRPRNNTPKADEYIPKKLKKGKENVEVNIQVPAQVNQSLKNLTYDQYLQVLQFAPMHLRGHGAVDVPQFAPMHLQAYGAMDVPQFTPTHLRGHVASFTPIYGRHEQQQQRRHELQEISTQYTNLTPLFGYGHQPQFGGGRYPGTIEHI